ncbi:valine--tRNA ligase [bacterium]|jgi:valyl-tRNA synthetase|nr:valine--tRNA ligase [bacterium]MBT3795663.1 valine--tRNA ligase [bacterium]MBT4634760.1 valine--tRNA ligase [bacterium]
MTDSSDFLSQKYSPKTIEDKWAEQVVVNDSENNQRFTYSMAIPPPNVTGNLHLGHALNTTIQDILMKFYSLNGAETTWSLGTDHAGIATQLLVEKNLSKKGINPKEISREELLQHIWKWKDENGEDILNQLKTLGLSCNWENPKFTLDEDMTNAVEEAFIRLYDKGLIYQEQTLINWDTKLKTAISDLEVISENRKSSLFFFKYPVKDSASFITVSTTRPETVFGDVAVIVNPNDEINKDLVGKEILSPFNGNILKIISDEYADMTKGSGVVKITPAHDFNDYKIGKKYNLPIINILNDDGTLNDYVPEQFRNLSVLKGREKVIEFMNEIGVFVKEEKVNNAIPIGDRSGEIIEPLLKNQWFLDVKEMANKSLKVVQDGKVKFKPKFWENTFYEWMNKIQPWCISRQIIWGHRIPVWHSDDGRSVAAKDLSMAKEKFLAKYNEEKELYQENDVLDTWFSSSLWPFATLGWPEVTSEYKKYFPTSLLVTGFDIIFFWVARMIMMSLELTGKVPFEVVYIHNLIRDKKGQKMSKTKGNVIDPLDLITEYGTDALRFFLSSNISPHSDIKLSPNSLEPYKNFMNKIWNAAKFIDLNKEDTQSKLANISFYDAWISSRFNNLLDRYKTHIDNCEIEKASFELYHFFWDDFCDWYIEIAKISFSRSKDTFSSHTKIRMRDIFYRYLNLLYPFAPFIALELKDNFAKDALNKKFTTLPEKLTIKYSGDFDKEVQLIKDFTIGIRSLRKNLLINPSDKIVCFYNNNNCMEDFLSKNKTLIESLCNLKSFTKVDQDTTSNLISNLTPSGSVSFLKESDVDFSNQIKKLKKDLVSLERIYNLSESKLKNNGFLKSAPQHVVKEEKQKADNVAASIDDIKSLISQLS